MTNLQIAIVSLTGCLVSGMVFVNFAVKAVEDRVKNGIKEAYHAYDRLPQTYGQMPDGTRVLCINTGREYERALEEFRASFGLATYWSAAVSREPKPVVSPLQEESSQ